jgi:hypothetical protein
MSHDGVDAGQRVGMRLAVLFNDAMVDLVLERR